MLETRVVAWRAALLRKLGLARVECTRDVPPPPAQCRQIPAGPSAVASAVLPGRPFVVRGRPRTADVISSTEFLVPIQAPNALGLSSSTRERLARVWTQIGQMEHASIAAFARFCLQLMQLGAPAALISDCQAAMADETRHAQLAFSLASYYGRTDVGPAALPMDGVFDARSLAEIAQLVVREGCIGETIAALEAAEAQAHCEDIAVSRVLSEICDDEQNHAALAWRFLEWALERDPSLVDGVSASVDLELATLSAAGAASPCPDADLVRHGVLSEALRREVRTVALHQVVAPAMYELVSRVSTQTSAKTVSAGHPVWADFGVAPQA